MKKKERNDEMGSHGTVSFFVKNKPHFGHFRPLNLFYANIFLMSSTQRQLEILTFNLIFIASNS